MLTYTLSKQDIGHANVSINEKQFIFGYPCDTSDECTPYSVILSKGFYKIEIWGSSGSIFDKHGTPGLGSYTSGILSILNTLKLFLYIGAHTKFNYMTNDGRSYAKGGASSDVRLTVNKNFDWFDPISLRSRIMVAAGGGSAEWPGSVGGNAGGLTGQDGKSDCNQDGNVCSNIITKGATQTKGGIASKENIWYPSSFNSRNTGYDGAFGRIPDFGSGNDIGGMGGNGYYSGATLMYSGGGSGGSSFISGHKGCIALNSSFNENLNPTNSSVHYSNIYFTNTKMIPGNEEMPLYFYSSSKGIGNKYNGCIRITILSGFCSNNANIYFRYQFLFYSFSLILFNS